MDKYNDDYLIFLHSKFKEEEKEFYQDHLDIYLKYGKSKEFVLDFDDIWPKIGFKYKTHAKTLLTKHFKDNEDYKISLTHLREQKQGGLNKEDIYLKIDTYKTLFMIANTEQSRKIKYYYTKFSSNLIRLIFYIL
jgi:phage anti-repressor protein